MFQGNLVMSPGTHTLKIWSSPDSELGLSVVDAVKPEQDSGYALSSTVTQSTEELNRKAWFTASPVFNALARFETKVLFPNSGQKKVPARSGVVVQDRVQVLVSLHAFSGWRHILGWLSQYSAVSIAALVAPIAYVELTCDSPAISASGTYDDGLGGPSRSTTNSCTLFCVRRSSCRGQIKDPILYGEY